MPKLAAKAATSPVGCRRSSGGTGSAGAGEGTQHPPHGHPCTVPARLPKRGDGRDVTGEVTLTGRIVVVGAAEPLCAAPQLGVNRHGDSLVPVRGHPHAQPTRHGHPVSRPCHADPCRHHSQLSTARGQGQGWDGMGTQNLRVGGSGGRSIPPRSPLCRYGCPSSTAMPFTERFRPLATTVSIPKVMCSACDSAVSAGDSSLWCVPAPPAPLWLLTAMDAMAMLSHTVRL